MSPSDVYFVKRCSAIYMIKNIQAGKVYIGSAVDIRKRLVEHVRRLKLGTSHNQYLQRSWNLYGEQAFEFHVVEEVLDQSALLFREQMWIDSEKSDDPQFGFNFMPAEPGRLGKPRSNETKKKISDANRGKRINYKHSEETKRRIGDAHIGLKFSDEAKKRMSDSAKRRIRTPLSAETKAKIGEANKGRKISDEQRAIISAANTGRKPSEVTRAKLSESGKRDWGRRKSITQQNVTKKVA